MGDVKHHLPVLVAAAAGAAAGAVAAYCYFKASGVAGASQSSKPSSGGTGSTTGSTGGIALYETEKAVNEYLQFHFGADSDILPYENGPKTALNFPARCAVLCERFCDSLKDFNGELDPPTALDMGCAVGGASFELAKSFEIVVGMDYSQHFIDAANRMKFGGPVKYRAQIEGDIMGEFIATIPDDVEVDRIRFMRGDACNIPQNIGPFDVVLASNLLCRLPDPYLFLRRLPTLVKPGGIVVLVSPYSWLEAWTPKSKWVGATVCGNQNHSSFQALSAELSGSFTLIHHEDMPFLIREHVRKYQWGCSHATVWKRNVRA